MLWMGKQIATIGGGVSVTDVMAPDDLDANACHEIGVDMSCAAYIQ